MPVMKCPHCDAKNRFSPKQDGRQGVCSGCGESFVYSTLAVIGQSWDEGSEADPPRGLAGVVLRYGPIIACFMVVGLYFLYKNRGGLPLELLFVFLSVIAIIGTAVGIADYVSRKNKKKEQLTKERKQLNKKNKQITQHKKATRERREKGYQAAGYMNDVVVRSNNTSIDGLADVHRKDGKMLFNITLEKGISKDFLTYIVEDDNDNPDDVIKLDEGTVSHPSGEQGKKIRCSIPDCEDGTSVTIAEG